MISGFEIEQEKENNRNSTPIYRMAIVKALISGRPIIRFYGDDSDSSKAFKYLQSYSPSAGDKVLTVRINGTYIILGKVV